MRLARAALLLWALAAPAQALAQGAVIQSGPWTPGHAPAYFGNGGSQAFIGDSGPASGGNAGSGLSELLLVAPPVSTGPLGTNVCDYDALPSSGLGYHALCFSPNAQGGGLISYSAGNGAAQLPLIFNINGVNFSLGDTAIAVGSTVITGGTPNGLFYDAGGLFGNLATAASGVLVTSAGGVPSIATTLPSGLTIPSPTITTPTIAGPTVTGSFTATGLVTLADLAPQAANTVLVNATAFSASPTAQAAPSCSGAADALNWTTSTGLGCNTAITAAAVPASGLTGTALATNVVTSSLTTVGTIGTGVWQGSLVGATYGGTGVNNGSSTLTLAGNLTTSGAFASTFTMTGSTSVTFPTSGTLATTATAAVASVGNASADTSLTIAGTGSGPWTGAVTAKLNLAHNNSFSVSQSINESTASLFASSDFTIQSVDGGGSGEYIVNSAANGVLELFRTNGTFASPTGLVASNGIGVFAWGGYDGTANKHQTAFLNGIATGTWVDGSDYETKVTVGATPAGSITSETEATFQAGIASGSGTPQGVGTINAPNGFYVGSTKVLSGTTLASTITSASGLATVGTIGTGTWQGSLVAGTYGGTGVNNGANTITIGASLATTGAGAATFALGASTQTYTFPTVTDTIPGLGQANAFTGNESHSGTELFTGTTIPTMASGSLFVGGTHAAATFNGTAQGDIHLLAANGLVLQGDGSTCDVDLVNNAGGAALCVLPGTQNVRIVGVGSAANPSLGIGNTTTGLYSVSTTGLGVSVNGAVKIDWGITNSAAATIVGNLFAPGLAALSGSTTGYVCWTTSTGAVSEDSATCLSSLRRLKRWIEPLDDALAEIAALRPSTFFWRAPNDENQRGSQIGMIAEDVADVDPRLASYSAGGALHGWREDAMIALLARGEQQLIGANDNFEARLTALERKVR